MSIARVGTRRLSIAAIVSFAVPGCGGDGHASADESSSSAADESSSGAVSVSGEESSSSTGTPEPACTSPCADEPEIMWQTTWGTEVWESAFGVAVQGQGHIAVTGPVDWPATGGFVDLYDIDGSPIVAIATPEAGYDVVWNSNDSFVFVGTAPEGEGKLRIYQADGTQLSESSPTDATASTYALRALPMGGYVVGGGTPSDGVLEYFDAAGMATGSVTTPVNIAVKDLAPTSNGVLFIGEDGVGNFVAGAFDAARVLKWSDEEPAMRALAITALTDGTIVASFRRDTGEAALRFYEPNGTERATLPIAWSGALVTGLLPLADGDFIAAISVESPQLHCQLARYDSSGTQHWGVSFESTPQETECVGLAPGPDDTLVVAGGLTGFDQDGDTWLLRIAR